MKIFSIFVSMLKNKNLSQFFTIASKMFMVLILLLSSCTTKRGIKAVLNIPINVSKTYDSENYIHTAQVKEFTCVDFNFGFTDKQELEEDQLSPGILPQFNYELPETYSFIKADILSRISPKFIAEVPKYLLFKKLIIHQF